VLVGWTRTTCTLTIYTCPVFAANTSPSCHAWPTFVPPPPELLEPLSAKLSIGLSRQPPFAAPRVPGCGCAEMDGFEDNTGVVIMAATNRPASLDQALTRPGRFDRIVNLPLPNLEVR
jgi:hypothetical protein